MSIEARIHRWIRPDIIDLEPYHVPDARGMTKLDAMENPYSWPKELRDLWLQRLAETPLNRYPDAAANELRTSIAAWCHLDSATEVLLGNGSDELIQILVLALGGARRTILAPEPTFVMYRLAAKYTGTDYVGVSSSDALAPDLEALLQAIEKHKPSCVFLAHPNNPTGGMIETRTVEAVVAATDGLVVVDEAYHVFCGHSYTDLVPKYDNLVVMRTFSKLGLAGLRLGFLIGPREWLKVLDRVRLPYNINALTQASALFALEHMAWFEERAVEICVEREALLQRLSELPGIELFPSAANFLLFRVSHGCAGAIFDGLRKKKVLIKNLHGTHASLVDCLRVTIGTAEQNGIFFNALKEQLVAD